MSRLQERFLSGDLSASSRMEQVLPYINNAQDIMKGGLADILQAINTSINTRAAGMGQQIGESIISSGAVGHDVGNAWATAMSPLYASGIEAGAMARERNTAGVSTLEASKGTTLAGLMALSQQGLLTANQLENMSIGGMKDSTVAGDIFGGITSIMNILPALLKIDWGKLLNSGAPPGTSVNPEIADDMHYGGR
jgi:hypothetical protein